MDSDLDQALQVDVLARMLQAGQREASELVELLAKMLESALPDRAKVTRAGWFMSKTRPVETLTVQFEEVGYVINKSKHGSVSVKQQKIVRGVALKSSDVTMEQCITDIVAELQALSQKNSAARQSLNKFLSGGG